MRFVVDDADLSLWLELDDEPATLDLTRDGLGDRILDAAVEEMIRAHARQESPAGVRWAKLAAATVKQKGHATIGVRTGGMLDPDRWRTAPRDLEARRVAVLLRCPPGPTLPEPLFQRGDAPLQR